MSKFNEELEKYRVQLQEVAPEYSDGWLEREAQRLGPNIYDADASLVSCTDAEEIGRVKAAFQKRFDGTLDEQDLDTAVHTVCQKMASQRRKYRAVFYYMLTMELGRMEGEGCSS